MFKKAAPVWAKDLIGKKNTMLSFETEVMFEGKQAAIRIAADALYRLHINGAFVSHGPARCGANYWRVDEIDITSYMKKGSNTIAVSVVSYGVYSYEYVMQPGFLQAEVTVDGAVAAATGVEGDFTARQNLSKEVAAERYSFQRPFIEVWHLPMEYSQALALTEVENIKTIPRYAPYPEYRQNQSAVTVAEGTFVCAEPEEPVMLLEEKWKNQEHFFFHLEEVPVLYQVVLSQIRNTSCRELPRKAVGQSITLESGEFKIVALAVEETGFISCDISCKEDSLVYFTFDEIMVDGDVQPLKHMGTLNLIPVYLKPGEHHFMGLEPRTMKYIKILCPTGAVEIKDFGLVEYKNPQAEIAKFHSDDEALNRIYAAAVNTFAQNAVDIFMDCPSRERAGWLCDSFFTGRAEKVFTGRNQVEKGFLENFLLNRTYEGIPEGMLPMCYPSNNNAAAKKFIPNWAMFAVIELEEYVARTGDTEMLAKAKDHFYALEKYFTGFMGETGLLEKLEMWVFVEWSQANEWVQDINFPSNMMYYAMLKSMARMYGDAALEAKAEQIKQRIQELSFNGTFFRDHMVYGENGVLTTPEDITEVCQYYAFFTGVADKEHYGELLQIIARDFGAGGKCQKIYPQVYPANAFIGNFLRMEVLSENGCRSQILDEIKAYFDYMACLTGTLWENDTAKASCNHGFASYIAGVIFRDVLGIQKVDETTKSIYLNDDYTAPATAQAVLPLAEGSVIITVKDHKRTVEVKGNYTCKE